MGVKVKIDRSKLVVGARVALDQTTLTIMRILPREIDPMVFNMMSEDPGKVDFSDIGGLGDQLRILRETIELPLTNPELFKRVGIKPPKGKKALYFRMLDVRSSRNRKNSNSQSLGL